jgi:hypothetical protein
MNIPIITTDQIYEDSYNTIDNTNYFTIIRPYRGLNCTRLKNDINRLTKLLSNISKRINSGENKIYQIHFYLVNEIKKHFNTLILPGCNDVDIIKTNKQTPPEIQSNIDKNNLQYFDYISNSFIKNKPINHNDEKINFCSYDGKIINIKYNNNGFFYDVKFDNGNIKLDIEENLINKKNPQDMNYTEIDNDILKNNFTKYLSIDILQRYIAKKGLDKIDKFVIEPFFHNYDDRNVNKFELIFKVTYTV